MQNEGSKGKIPKTKDPNWKLSIDTTQVPKPKVPGETSQNKRSKRKNPNENPQMDYP